MFNKMTLRNSLLAAACSLALIGQALADTPRSVNVQAGDLAQALDVLAKQCGVDVVYPSKQLKGMTTKGVSGTLETREAFERLIEGTRLVLREEGKSVMISLPKGEARRGEEEGIRLAQAEAAGVAGGSEEEVEAKAEDGEQEDGVKLEEIVVTGTHIRNANSQISPVYRYSRRDIEISGVADVAGLLRTIPQNFLGGDLGATPDGRFGSGTLAAFNDSGAVTPNLRGLGSGSTLTLVNGRRLAPTAQGAVPDIGMIPLAAIERVEILADGASAIYGADGVAGVVNIILRDKFDGIGASLEAVSDDGGDYKENKVSLSAGRSWNGGSALLIGAYNDADPLFASKRPFSRDLPIYDEPQGRFESQLYPNTDEYSFLATARQRVGSRLQLSADAWWSHRDRRQIIVSPLIDLQFFEDQRATVEQGSFAGAADVDLTGSWHWRTDALYTAASEFAPRDTYLFGGLFVSDETDRDSSITSLTSKVDGTLLSLRGNTVSAAAGIDYRKERYDFESVNSLSPRTTGAADRSVRSVFGEVLIPLASALRLSIASRYDDYSDFGDDTTYKIGARWSMTSALAVRATYGTSFRAPDLGWTQRELGFLSTGSGYTDPSGTGSINVVQLDGTAKLRAEKSNATTVGLDFTPQNVDGLALGLTWFRYDYTDRLSAPPFDIDMLTKPNEFGPLIRPVTSETELTDFIDQIVAEGGLSFLEEPLSQYDYIVDLRYQNVAGQEVEGMDFTGNHSWRAGSFTITPAFSAALLFKDDRQITSTASPIETLKRVGEQAKLRVRALTSVSRLRWTATAALNYSGGFDNQFVPDEVPVDEWFTVDLSAQTPLLLAGTDFNLSIAMINVFDEDPPFVDYIEGGPFYDPANANPLGRYFTLQVTAKW